jgi:hypothetical protein
MWQKLLIVLTNLCITGAILIGHALLGFLVILVLAGGGGLIEALNHHQDPLLFGGRVKESDIFHFVDVIMFFAIAAKGIKEIYG